MKRRKNSLSTSGGKTTKRYNTQSNAYARTASKGEHKLVPVASDYAKMFQTCDSYNHQIKSRMWPHKHGGRGHIGERGKHSSLALACVLQNTFNGYRSIMRLSVNVSMNLDFKGGI